MPPLVTTRYVRVDLCVPAKRSVSHVDRCRHDGKDGRTSGRRRRHRSPEPLIHAARVAGRCRPGLDRPLDPASWQGMRTRTLVADRRGAGGSTDPGSGRDFARPRSASTSLARSTSAGRRPKSFEPARWSRQRPYESSRDSPARSITLRPSRPGRVATRRRTVGNRSSRSSPSVSPGTRAPTITVAPHALSSCSVTGALVSRVPFRAAFPSAPSLMRPVV